MSSLSLIQLSLTIGHNYLDHMYNIYNVPISIALILIESLFGCQPKLHSNKQPNESKESLYSDPKLKTILSKELDQIFADDQNPRQLVQGTSEKYGWTSPQMKVLTDSIMFLDSINLIKVKKILDEYGWLGTDIVSENGNSALFLVLQHSDAKTREYYLPMMRNAVTNKIADPVDLAMMEDRTALDRGEKQIYGTQVGYDKQKGCYYLFPLIDSVNVNDRRKKMGLGQLSDYLKKYKIPY